MGSAQALATAVVNSLDLRHHAGAHPRFGVLDVVPFVPYVPHGAPASDLTEAVALRNAFAHWLGLTLGVPAYPYGPLPGGGHRTLPELRRALEHAGREGTVTPLAGPSDPDPRTGVTAVGARRALVAYNVWVSSVEVARQVARQVRSPEVRALGLALGARAQVSCNLIDPAVSGPAHVYDMVDGLMRQAGGRALGGELVGLVPETVLADVPRARWHELGLSAEDTVEARLADPGR